MIIRTKKAAGKVILFALIVSLITSPLVYASDSIDKADVKTVAQKEAESQVTNLLTQGYSPYYDILGIKTEITDVEDTKDSLDVYVKTTMKAVLKAKSVAELPYVQGMMKALKLTDLKKDNLENTAKAIEKTNDLKLNDIQLKKVAKLLQDKITDIEPYIGKPDDTNFMFKYTIPKTKDSVASGSGQLLFEDMEQYFPANHILPKSSEEMIKDGIKDIMTEINSSKLDKKLDFYYDRLAARDYAIANTSWATTWCPHHKCQQDTTYWNTGHYPAYLYNFCHNDCADFVSQALAYGGIPKTSNWTRDYADQSWTYAWQNVEGLRNYMINNGYWIASSWTYATAGGIRVWPGHNHIGMIIKNDTVTREFAAHTYDRTHYAYSDEGMEYYVIP